MYPISNLVIFHFYLEFRNCATVPIVNSGIKINRYFNRERAFRDLGLQKEKRKCSYETKKHQPHERDKSSFSTLPGTANEFTEFCEFYKNNHHT